jgi:Tol biopolymer transport system component
MTRARGSLAVVSVVLAGVVAAAPSGASTVAQRGLRGSFIANPAADHAPAQESEVLAPSTSVIAFASFRNGRSSIATATSDGRVRSQLTRSQPSFVGQPAYSPDGSKIAYVCGNFELCVMNADGNSQGRLITSRWPQRWEYIDDPTWSPDGSKIAFASNADGKFHVYVINADGSGLHKLVGTSWNDDDPAWSPDGTKIAFDRYRSWSVSKSAVYVMNADGTQPHQLAKPDVWDPAWSPDGTALAASGLVNDQGNEYTHLFLIDASAGGKRQLTEGFCEESNPAWSPDGSTLAFERSCRGRLGLAVGKFGGQIWRITAPRRGFDINAAWRPNPSVATAPMPIGPPSAATGDARLVTMYFFWSVQVWEIDFLPFDSLHVEQRARTDDLAAVAALRAAHPSTRRGGLLRRTAVAAFRLGAAASREFVLGYQASAEGKRRLTAKHNRLGNTLEHRAEQKFEAADNIAHLPY